MTTDRAGPASHSGLVAPAGGERTKLLGVIVVNGLSSENRVFATLLAGRDERYDARVLMHQASGDSTAHRFAELSRSPTVAFDTGWRPSPYVRRGNPLRAGVALRYVRGIESLVGDAQRYRPDVVYSSQQHYDCRAASKVARAVDASQIVHLHYTIGPWLRRVVLDRLHTTDHVVAVSDFIRRQAIDYGVPAERVTTVHNAVRPFPTLDRERIRAVQRELGLPADVFTYGMVSRIDEGKGHLDAIAAFERIAARDDDVRLVIVGSGRLDRTVRETVARSTAANQIVLAGFRTDVPDLLAAFDALVHPATEDPCPLAVLEAMAARLPVLAYDDGGLPELVSHGETGLLVAHSRIDLLADAMDSLRADPTSARQSGQAGCDRLAARFNPEQASERFASIVTSVV